MVCEPTGNHARIATEARECDDIVVAAAVVVTVAIAGLFAAGRRSCGTSPEMLGERCAVRRTVDPGTFDDNELEALLHRTGGHGRRFPAKHAIRRIDQQ